MKLCIFANSCGFLYSFKRELLEKMISSGIDVVVAAPDGERRADIEAIGCKVTAIDVDRRGVNPIKDYKLLKAYRRLLREQRPDKVLTFTAKCNVYGGMAAKKAGIPYFASVTGLGTGFQRPLIRCLLIFLYRKALKKAENVFFENADNRAVFLNRKIVRQEKTVLLTGSGVNLDSFSLLPMTDTERCEFLFVGRIMREKGIGELLQAAEKCVAEKKNVCFTIVGGFEEESYREKLQALEASGALNYAGQQSDVVPFYGRCSCVVLPSYHEGMSNTLLEGAASGRPLITSDIAGCKEAVSNGENGYLVRVGDAEDLYRHLCAFAQLPFDKKQAMGAESRKIAEQSFDRNKVIEQTLDIINGEQNAQNIVDPADL